MTVLGWYAAIAALVFALWLDDVEPEAAALGALLWPLWALFVVGLVVLAALYSFLDAWRRP